MLSAKKFLEAVKEMCANTSCANCPFNIMMPAVSCDRILTKSIDYSIGVVEKYLEQKEAGSGSD